MSTPATTQGLLRKFSSNQRLVVGAAITVIHASIILVLIFDSLPRHRFLAYTAIPSLVTTIVPFLVTRPIIDRVYEGENMVSYLETLSESTNESTSIAAEVELTPEVLQSLPEEVSDPDAVKIIDEELLDHVEGEEFDSVDADARGVVAIGFASLLIVISAPIVGLLMDGMGSTMGGFICGLIASGIVLQQHRDMVDIIEYTPKSIST